jgi:hypothetical protein
MMPFRNKFGFIEAGQELTVNIRNNEYSVLKAGKGIPCLLICCELLTHMNHSRGMMIRLNIDNNHYIAQTIIKIFISAT